MTKEAFAIMMEETFLRLQGLRKAGQAEYAGGESAFGNFERVATQLRMDRKQVLWVYVSKHLDGIVSYLNGHRSQREEIEGRIDDVEVYLELLRAMIYEDKHTIEAEMARQQQNMQGSGGMSGLANQIGLGGRQRS